MDAASRTSVYTVPKKMKPFKELMALTHNHPARLGAAPSDPKFGSWNLLNPAKKGKPI